MKNEKSTIWYTISKPIGKRLALPVGQRFAVRVIGAVQAGVALGGTSEPVTSNVKTSVSVGAQTFCFHNFVS